MANNIQYKHVKNNNNLHFAPLFVSCHGRKRKEGIKKQYITSKNKKITVCMLEELGPDEQDLLFAILSIALPESRGAMLDSESAANQEIICTIDQLQNCKKGKEYIQIETTLYELLKEMGKTASNRSYNAVINSLKRLAKTSIELETDKYLGVIYLLHFFVDKTTKKIKITLNPVSSLSLLGLDNYVYIDREKYIKMSKIAKILYPFLRGLPRKTISIMSLLERVYSDSSGSTTNNDPTAGIRKKIQRILKALKEIATIDPSLSWKKIGRGRNTIIDFQ